jgi:hypothetical protein
MGLYKSGALKNACYSDSYDVIGKEIRFVIQQLQEAICWEERKCKDRIGLPPKLYARLIRFSKAYRIRESKH